MQILGRVINQSKMDKLKNIQDAELYAKITDGLRNTLPPYNSIHFFVLVGQSVTDSDPRSE